MFMHNKKLMYTVRVAEPNPGLATLMLEQFGGPQVELAAAMSYFTQGLADEDQGACIKAVEQAAGVEARRRSRE
jgi:Mn-containing catalase